MLRSTIIILLRKKRNCAPGCVVPLSVLNTRDTKLSNRNRLGLLSNSQTCDVIMVVMGLSGAWQQDCD